ncbi:MAG: hypothetical protein MUF61_01470 [archaeon]|jgi:hypothetical protein|nr:hypothetical protein [archaeon]
MEVKSVIVTVLIFVIVLSVATVALNMLTGNNSNVTIYKKDKGDDRASVNLFVEGGPQAKNYDGSSVGLYVEGGK